ncbi:MAG: hypothetical protein ACLFTT_03465 [Candidatus Hydrogenedentota bacterium]
MADTPERQGVPMAVVAGVAVAALLLGAAGAYLVLGGSPGPGPAGPGVAGRTHDMPPLPADTAPGDRLRAWAKVHGLHTLASINRAYKVYDWRVTVEFLGGPERRCRTSVTARLPSRKIVRLMEVSAPEATP